MVRVLRLLGWCSVDGLCDGAVTAQGKARGGLAQGMTGCQLGLLDACICASLVWSRIWAYNRLQEQQPPCQWSAGSNIVKGCCCSAAEHARRCE